MSPENLDDRHENGCGLCPAVESHTQLTRDKEEHTECQNTLIEN